MGSSGAAPNQPESVLFRVSVAPAPWASSTPGSPARSVDDAALAAYLSDSVTPWSDPFHR